jgi:hypothetical protein
MSNLCCSWNGRVEDIDAIAALQDPVRRRLCEYVVAQGREVGRNEAAEAAGVARSSRRTTWTG